MRRAPRLRTSETKQNRAQADGAKLCGSQASHQSWATENETLLAARSGSRKNCVVINVESLSELYTQFDLHTCINEAHGGVLRSHTTVSTKQHSVCTDLKTRTPGAPK